jgi:hypothetical protein
LVDLRPGVVVVPATQATHSSNSGKVTLKVTSISIKTSINSTKGSFLSSRSSHSTVRTSNQGGNQYQRQNNQAARLPAPATNPNNQAASVQVGGCACFYCGEQNHWEKNCPKKAAQQSPAVNALARQGAPQQAPGGCGQAYTRGKVNLLEAEAIQDAQDVAVGTFLVESYPTKVLFDTGATHSFVSTSWVEAHNIPHRINDSPFKS